MDVTFNASTIQKKYHCLTNKHYSWLFKKKKNEHDSCFLQTGLNKRNYIYIYIYIYVRTEFGLDPIEDWISAQRAQTNTIKVRKSILDIT